MQPRTKSMHAHKAVQQLVSQGVPEDQAVLATYGHPHPAPAPAIDFDSDEPLSVCPMRDPGTDVCEGCQ